MAKDEKRKSIGRARRICLLIVFLSIVVGLFVRAGWGTLSSLGVNAVAYLCPLGALETLVAARTMVPRAVVALVCAVVVVALFGRFFCAWVCPVPPIGRFFRGGKAKKSEKEGEKEGDACTGCASGCTSGCGLDPVGGARDGLRFDSRHGVLLGALLSSAVCGFPVFCLICPVGLSIAVAVGLYGAIFQQNPTVSLPVFAAILLVELVFFRKWCHKACPLGALMSLIGAKAPLARPRVDAEKCLRSQGIDCRVCASACPELLDPHSPHIPECTKCGECADVCPAHAISFRQARASRKIPHARNDV